MEVDSYEVTDLAVIHGDASETLAMIEAMDASTPEGMATVGEVTVAVKLMLKQIDELRSAECDPLHKEWKAARKKYTGADDLLKKCEARLKAKIAAADEANRLAATRAVAAAAGDPVALERIVAPELPKNISTRPIARVRVVDKSKVPLDCLLVDEGHVLLKFKLGEDVPGCELYYDTQVTVRT